MLTKYAEAFEVLETIEVPRSAGANRLARLRRQAHRHNFEYQPRPGYIYVRSRAISSRCNDNYDEFPAEEIKKAYASFVGKPVFVNHHNADHRRARGVIIDAALHEDTNPDGTPDVWAEVLMEVDAVRFPMLAKAVLAGDIARTSMGTDVAYSVCTACGNKAETPADYCQHIPRMKGMKIHRTLASGQKEEVLVAERCYGLRFFENSLLVEDPADPTAFVLGVEDGSGLTASAAKAIIEEAEQITREAASGSDETFYREIANDGGILQPQGIARLASRKTSATWTESYYGDEGTENIEYEGIGEGQVFPTMDPTPADGLQPNGKWGWDVVLYDDPVKRPYGEETSKADAKRRVEEILSGGQDTLFQASLSPHEAGFWDKVKEVFDTGYDDRYQCPDCKATFRWFPALHTFACPNGHGTRPAFASKQAAPDFLCEDCGVPVERSEAFLRGGTGHAGEWAQKAWCRSCAEERGWAPRSEASSGLPRAAAAQYGPINSRNLGRCYELAGKRVAFGPTGAMFNGYVGSTLVHGTIQGFGNPRLGHAWVIEPSGDVWEPATDTVYSAADFEELFNPEVEVTYAVDDARKQMSRNRHYGPWHDGLGFQASRHEAYGEQKAPAQVDTMRAENCPVCGDDEAFNGERCSVCGYTQPPEQFRDPDLSKAKEMDLRQDAEDRSLAPEEEALTDEQPSDTLECDSCGETFDVEGDDDQADAPEEPEAAEAANPFADDGDADPKDEEEPAPDEDDAEDDLSDLAEKDDDELEEALDAEEPEEEKVADEDAEEPEDLAALNVVPGQTCPVCGQGTLRPQAVASTTDGAEEPQINEVGKVPVRVSSRRTRSRDMAQQTNPAKVARNRILSALQGQQQEISALKASNARLARENAEMRRHMATLVRAAGVGNHPRFASLMKRVAAEGGNDPDGAPDTTTEQAKTPQATDDVESIGAAPAGVNENVTPEAVTDVQNSNVAITEPLLDNMQDVTQPVAGTDAVPADGNKVETEVRVSAPSNDVMDPPGSSGWTAAKGDPQQRFMESLRLARLQIQAGLETGEDLILGQRIADSEQSLGEIRAAASALSAVATRQQPSRQETRHLVPRAATRQPSLQQAPATHVASAAGGDDEFMFGGGVE